MSVRAAYDEPDSLASVRKRHQNRLRNCDICRNRITFADLFRVFCTYLLLLFTLRFGPITITI